MYVNRFILRRESKTEWYVALPESSINDNNNEAKTLIASAANRVWTDLFQAKKSVSTEAKQQTSTFCLNFILLKKVLEECLRVNLGVIGKPPSLNQLR